MTKKESYMSCLSIQSRVFVSDMIKCHCQLIKFEVIFKFAFVSYYF